MGDHTPIDNRDQDAVCEAGRYLRALTHMEMTNQGGAVYREILSAYYSREGIPLHRTRMQLAIEELDRKGVRIRRRRCRSRAEIIDLYTNLLQEAIDAYGKSLRATQ